MLLEIIGNNLYLGYNIYWLGTEDARALSQFRWTDGSDVVDVGQVETW